MFRPASEARHASINLICSFFVTYKVRSTHDLSVHLKEIANKINQDSKIFSPADSLLHRTEIFIAAIAAYARITEYNIKVPDNIDWSLFQPTSRHETHDVNTDCLDHKDVDAITDLSKVTQSYDQLLNAVQANKATNKAIKQIIKNNDYSICDAIILGAGDTGTTIWLEKYKKHHKKTNLTLSQGKLPSVLVISDSFGSWKHDYTLAQTLSSLERSNADSNPSNFLPTSFYQKNPQANGRHVYQANQICLGSTQAPILKANVLKVEKKENHPDWKEDGYPYRLIIQISKTEFKTVYASNIEICTGLGAPNLAINENIIKPDEFKLLNQFNERLGFTPIVDGNQFVLTDSEEGKNNKSIVIYGGGGTASACYRKSFFGTDIRTYNRPYTIDHQKNKVTWVFRDFIGTGKMAATALRIAQERKEVYQAELVKISQMKNSQLILEFKFLHSDGSSFIHSLKCDQLIYSTGQDDLRMRQVCSEISADLQFHHDKSGMLLYVSSLDKRISFYGASAISFRKSEFIKQTTAWLDAQNIGGDVGAGSMPPTRAQVKQYLALFHNIKPESINTNMDTTCLIKDFLFDARIEEPVVFAFVDDLLLARKDDTYGCSRQKLELLLKKHKLDQTFDIYGHSHLVVKGKSFLTRAQSLPNLLIHNDKKICSPRAVQDDTKYKAPDVYFRASANSSLFSGSKTTRASLLKNNTGVTPIPRKHKAAR